MSTQGLSLAVDLIALPLPLSVCLGTDCDADDPPELCQFTGFYPVLIWNLPQNTTENPVDVMASKLASDISSSPSYPQPKYTAMMEKLLLQAMQIIQSSSLLREFVESSSHNSTIDQQISAAQQWIDSGETSHLNLPAVLNPPDPATLKSMKCILSATQMSFETGYSRPVQDHTIYVDCVKTVHCRPGKRCRLVVTAEEIVAQIPGATASQVEGVWVGFDTTPEGYITHDTIEWAQVVNGKAVYEFVQNTDTPVLLGVSISRYDLPQVLRDIQDKNLQLCRRYVVFDRVSVGMPWINLLLGN